MERLIACCGLDCEKCDARIATLNNDIELKKKTASLWSELNGVTITEDMIVCNGCRTEGSKTPFCEHICEIRKCVMKNGYNTCGDCKRLDECQELARITCNASETIENLKRETSLSAK